jgi:hypothetical protein
LGLRHAVGGLSEKLERDILMQDFKTIESTSFTFEGSKQTPDEHRFSNFRFESFAPIAFHYFRKLFYIRPQDFLVFIGIWKFCTLVTQLDFCFQGIVVQPAVKRVKQSWS